MSGKVKAAILGSGNIGTDLLAKLIRSEHLECSMFIGRNLESKGIKFAKNLNIPVSDKSINEIVDNPNLCKVVFDCTSAAHHLKHWPILKELGIHAIDMTPSGIGNPVVPAISLNSNSNVANLNMVSCGGQASIPIAYSIAKVHKDIEYIEVVSSIASKSAGPATRDNIDNYIDTTELAIQHFTKCKQAKAILILNPAVPPINMQTTISAKVDNPNISKLTPVVDEIVNNIKKYVPGYEVVVPPVYEDGRIVVMVKVIGLGDYLPKYAGNLDIINCAAIQAAESLAEEMIK